MENNIPLARYRGVSRVSGLGETRWKAQIVRMGHTYYLGAHASPNVAGDAYDNAVYHSRGWVNVVQSFNNPAKWTGPTFEAPSRSTQHMLAKLNERYPQELERRARMQSLTVAQRYEAAACQLAHSFSLNSAALSDAVTGLIGQIRFLESVNLLLVEDVLKRDRIIQGLTSAGGRPMFRKIGEVWQEQTAVESHLTT